ncbi:hypothetical protein SAY87_016197 [Trapa incisa]|uniref:Armadillo repeat-containing protein 8 n=2 Tax=Trapa TaxID=22665 RepID=A0AAN7LHK5_TRANT|nr:hypothetical protein SAY87_016197 [Trapa incisa]KAK4785595.1 hypothetical protein SAY86_002284 [Trapa natans]
MAKSLVKTERKQGFHFLFPLEIPLASATMPTSASVSAATSASRPSTDLVARLGSSDREVQLKALRDVKNQIIGNRTKKLTYIKLGAVPAVASVLSDAIDGSVCGSSDLLVQSAATLGSFACGVDAGVRAVLDAGALPYLVRLLSSSDEKVIDSGARSLKMVYQSKLAPKYDVLQKSNMEFLCSLLNSENENANGLGASIITNSCKTSAEQKALCDNGVLTKLIDFLDGSMIQREASLESLASIMNENGEVTSLFVEYERGQALGLLVKLTNERSARTRLLACECLIIISNVSSRYLKWKGIETKLISYLLELLEEPGHIGDEASFALSNYIEDKEDLQKLACDANAIDVLCTHLQNQLLQPKRFEGILLALANICSRLEICRAKLLHMQEFNSINDALHHDCADVRAAACICLRSVSRSVQNLSAGFFMNEKIVMPVLQLLHDPSLTVQLAALRAIGNIVVDFRTHKSRFMKWGGVKQLIQLSMSMNSAIRLNSLWALKNLTFEADNQCKERVFRELTASSLASLICDPEPCVQEQALALVRNLIDGSLDSIEYVFVEGSIILNAIGRHLERASTAECKVQGMYVLSNIASGSEIHKDSLMELLFQDRENGDPLYILNFLQSNDSHLRTASVWVIVNLTNPSCLGASGRTVKLRNAGVISQLKNMVNDPCLDVKLRVRTVLGQCMTFGE